MANELLVALLYVLGSALFAAGAILCWCGRRPEASREVARPGGLRRRPIGRPIQGGSGVLPPPPPEA